MFTTDKKCLEEWKKLIIDDFPRIRQCSNIDFKYVVDIGANIGIYTLLMKYLFPHIKVIAAEPCKKTFKCLKLNTSFIPNVFTENKSLGSGRKNKIIPVGKTSLRNITIESDDGEIESVQLSYFFKKYLLDIKSIYALKFDCEGAEKYLIGDLFAEEAIRNSTHCFFEIHFNTPNSTYFSEKWEKYNNWINTNFKKTHLIEYYKSNKNKGYGHYCLLKNK